MTRAPVLALVMVVAGCAASDTAGANNPDGDGGGSGSVPLPCTTALDVRAPVPAAGPTSTVHVDARVSGSTGVLAFTWHVQFSNMDVAFTSPAPDAIDFAVPTAGVYVVSVEVTGGTQSCPVSIVPINITAPGALSETLRLRVVPPHSVAAPPMEKLIEVRGGADADLGVVVVDPGTQVNPVVLGPTGGVPAYLRFSPGSMPDAIIEAFSDASGVASVQLIGGVYSVLVVPPDQRLAPRRFAGWSPGAVLSLDAGLPVSGTVLGPGGALAGATVRIASDGVPSTLATTATDGSFTLHAVPGLSVTVEVTPPAGSGLPRLSATAGFDLGAPMQIAYAANPGLVDLGGAVVRRAAIPRAGAHLTVVGSLPAVGMVTAGSSSVVASGELRIAATADAAGVVPATLVPAAQLSAVVEVAPGDLTVVALDTRTTAPATIDAPAMQLITTAVLDSGGAGLPGAVVDLVPAGALAMAMAPTLRLAAAPGGVIAATLPAGGHYELRFQDPLRRAGPMVVPEHVITAIAPSYGLPAALHLQGSLRREGQPVAGAAVQILCTSCTGVERGLALVEVVSDATGRFTLAVPDPGTR